MSHKSHFAAFKRLILGTEFGQYGLAVFMISLTGLITAPLANYKSYHIVAFILLFVVSIMATFLRVGPILLASTLSALVWNFFFIPPYHTFHIDKTEDILTFGLFFIIAIVSGVLITKVRRQEKIARERETRTDALFQLTKELSKLSGIEEVLRVATTEIQKYFALKSYFILQDGNQSLIIEDRSNQKESPMPVDYTVAQWVFSHSLEAGEFTNNTLSADQTYYPLLGNRLNPGIVVVKQDSPFMDEQKSFWDTFLAQISNALEREYLDEIAQKARFLDESDRLYKTLFSSVSHELRIPLSTIMGAADSMLNSPKTTEDQFVLSQEIFTASLRLNRIIDNLLNITRLESGHISLKLEWHDINDLFYKVITDLEDELKPFSLLINVQDEMPLVKIDFGFMEQVLYNLLLNATQCAPGASNIGLNASYSNSELTILVWDEGSGFSESDLQNVFKKFFRVNYNRTGGLGLGLSIVKGIVEAHNGTITVNNQKKSGVKFTITIPSPTPDISKILTSDEPK